MTAAPLHFGTLRVMLDPSGLLWCPEAGVLAVADLHLEKSTAAAARGALLPPLDSRLTLERLWRGVARYRPRTLVAVGDSFHDRGGALRLGPAERDLLARIAGTCELVWVAGNHDPDPPQGLPGVAAAAFRTHGLVFRHEAKAGVVPEGGEVEICGHHHPKARVTTRAGTISRPCFIADSRRAILPAFGTYTGGLDVLHPAIAGLFPRGARVFLLGQQRLFSFTLAQVRAA